MVGTCVRCGVLLTLGVLQISHAQESNGKPEMPTPKTAQVPLPRYSSSSASRKLSHEPETVKNLSALATSLAGHISGAGCQPKSCTVLVTDFTFPDGNTSAYGLRLADALSRELTNKEYKLRVIERKALRTFLSKDRVP